MRFQLLFLTLCHAPLHISARRSLSIPGGIRGAYDTIPSDPTTLATRSSLDPITVAARHIRSISPDLEFKLNGDHYTDADTGVTHVFFTQTHRGLPIDNAAANVNVLRDGRILSVGSSFTTQLNEIGKRSAVVPPMDALQGVVDTLGLPLTVSGATAVESKSSNGTFKVVGAKGALSQPRAELVYYRTDAGIRLAWKVETDLGENWMVSYANAGQVGDILGAVDYVADEKYDVYKIGVNDPSDGKRELLMDPYNKIASPSGWHVAGTHSYTTTVGNNGIAHENWKAGSEFLYNLRPDGGPSLMFNFPFNATMEDPKSYIDAAVTQLFYTASIYHDLLELLGFTEEAGNFEEVNKGSLGLGGDAVQLNAQDGSGFNNANFATPPDGFRPRMRMYLWNNSTGNGAVRDGCFDNGIIIHEYTHGLSNRLTGGPSRATCLSTVESGGMGEGWSDFFATAIRIKPSDTRNTDYAVGDWANGHGIRRYKYSTSLTTNPTTYGTINLPNWSSLVHAIGSVWGNILYEVLWNLEDKHGYQEEVFPTFRPGTSIPTTGRHLAMKIVLEAMKLQPCYPTFITARNAIIDADKLLTGGENGCELWKAFAKRGLGVNASQGSGSNERVEDFSMPAAAC